MTALDAGNLVALSLTNVYYDPTDPLAHLLAYLTLTPQLLFSVYLTLLYSTREIEIALTFAGQLACEAVNIALKRYFRELRPTIMRELHRGYGMPSSHAQFVSYFAVYTALFLLWRHSPSVRVQEDEEVEREGVWDAVREMNGGMSEAEGEKMAERKRVVKSNGGRRRKASVVINGVERPLGPDVDAIVTGVSSFVNGAAAAVKGTNDEDGDDAASPAYSLQLHHPKLTHAMLTLAVLGLAIVVAGSRVYLGYHTVKQVLVGFAAGSTFAVLWFGVTEWLRRTGWIEWALDLTLVRSMRVRDLVCEEDLVEIGWQVWEDKRRRRKAINHAKATKNAKSR